MAKAKTKAKSTSFLDQLFEQLYGSQGAKDVFSARALDMKKHAPKFKTKKASEAYAQKIKDTIASQQKAYTAAPLSVHTPYKDFTKNVKGLDVEGNALKNTGAALLETMKNNKGMTALTGGLGLANVAGLVDNDNIIGQLGGSVLGGLAGSKLFGLKPYGTINTALAGGAIGGLFDFLRSKKAQEEQYQQQYYGG